MLHSTKRKYGCLRGFFIVVILLFAALGLFSVVTGSPSSWIHDKEPTATMGADEFPELNEVWAYGDGESKVIHIRLSGMISLGDKASLLSPLGETEMALMSIRRATKDEEVQTNSE